MTIEELRIGNYVCVDNYPANPQIVMGITHPEFNGYSRMEESDLVLKDKFDGHFYEVNIDKCDPIPLTAEWLLKFSFSKQLEDRDEYWAIQIGNNLHLTISLNDATAGIDLEWRSQGSQLWKMVTSVHEVQNIFYALTGEELEVKL